MTRSKAVRLRALVEQAAASLPDREASKGAALFPKMKHDGSLIKAGTRINWHGVLKLARADLWDTEDNSPDNAPALWQDIAYREGVRIIPETITAAEAFSRGECGWWNGVIYKSVMDGNVHTPDDYPAGWSALTNG